MHRIKCGIAFTAGFLLKAVHWLTCCMPLLINVQVINAGLEHINDDELVEVTPKTLRLRKAVLDRNQRGRDRKRALNAASETNS